MFTDALLVAMRVFMFLINSCRDIILDVALGIYDNIDRHHSKMASNTVKYSPPTNAYYQTKFAIHHNDNGENTEESFSLSPINKDWEPLPDLNSFYSKMENNLKSRIKNLNIKSTVLEIETNNASKYIETLSLIDSNICPNCHTKRSKEEPMPLFSCVGSCNNSVRVQCCLCGQRYILTSSPPSILAEN